MEAGVLEFDDSADKHLKAVQAIFRICGDWKTDQAEIKRVGSSITFLRQWRDYAYEPRLVSFSPETEWSRNGIELPQFSAAAVPKDTRSTSNSPNCSMDFILYCGGPIWGLDWCPQVRQDSGKVNCEFLAVAAHPPGSSYHKLGAPLIGRGVIQIWCLLNANRNDGMEELSIEKYRSKGLRGRPRKIQKIESHNDIHGGSEDVPTKRPVGRPRKDSADKSSDQKIPKPRGRSRKKQSNEFMNAKNELPKSRNQKRNQNNMQTESLNALCTSDSLQVLHNDDCNQALVPCYMEQSPQPVALDKVLVEQSASAKSGERTRTTLHTSDLACVDDFVPSGAITFSDNDSEVSLLLNRVKDSSTQPIKTYIRRHKVAKTAHYKETDKACANQFKESMTRIDNTDYGVKSDLETNVQRSQVRQQKYVGEELPASSSAFHHEKEYNFAVAKRMESGEEDANTGSCTQDTKYLSTATVDLDPLPLLHTTSGEQVVSFPTDCIIPQDIALPRLILCLAHNGKVAWDVKWRPIAHVSQCRLRMGYLAVLLGNGSLEVWDVPLPNVVCDIFSSSYIEGTDPRFMKLKPVFKCSKLKFGGRESIPLTVEWSASFPHDLLVAGCHDGTVAVWKFSEGNPCEDTRPLLCFRADTAPIRAVSWAPAENEGEDAKVIVTAGHTGLKFWDMRDPFHPLWTFPLLRIYSLDWMPNPRCVIVSSDDGSLKIISISEASDDLPVTGNPFSGSKLQGLHTYNCSSCAIWSIHISRVTGMAAYCGADGTVVRFQLTTKAVEKDHSRNRVPHFLFGSLTENDSVLTINTPPSNTHLQLKKPNAGPQSMRALIDLCNQSQTNYNLQSKKSPSYDQTLALCNGNDLRQDHYMPTASAGPIRQGESSQDELAMVRQVVGAKNTSEDNPLVKSSGPVPKLLAMHRVRWNMNKGSERWLSSGGAAGIVRCQEIVFTDVDKMYYSQR